MVQLDLKLPDSLAREAQAAGLLTPQAIEQLLREEIRRRRVGQLFEAADRLAALDMPPLTEAEVEAEIKPPAKRGRHIVRVVADTNTVISGLLWHGAPRRLLDAARAGKLDLFPSPFLPIPTTMTC